MKLRISTIIGMAADDVWTEVQTAQLLAHVAWPLMRFVPVGDEALDQFVPGGRYQVKLRLFGFIPFGRQWIETSVHLRAADDWPKRLRDDGHSALISTWDHWITVEPAGATETRYTDALEIKAGLLTPLVWLFAQAFYHHRQRRWRGLARTLWARRLNEEEMTAYADSRGSGDTEAAWAALERAHIIAQPFLGLHITNHMAMLRFAWALRDAREMAGQLARLALAPLGALTGRIPVGNSGRSHVSAFQPMPVSADLKARIDAARR